LLGELIKVQSLADWVLDPTQDVPNTRIQPMTTDTGLTAFFSRTV